MKYDLSIGVMFNNEAPYLKEWIDHNLNRGVDHIYMIDDNSDDDFMDVLKDYEKNITLFQVKERNQFSGRQQVYYNKFLMDKLPDTKWIMICDVDEYIWSPRCLELKKVCNYFQKSDVYNVAIPMILFGSNGHIQQPKSIVEGFTKRAEINQNYKNFTKDYNQYKCLTWASEIIQLNVHSHWIPAKTLYLNSHNLETDIIRMNHYRLQSEEKWKRNLEKFDVNNYQPKNSANASPLATAKIKTNSKNYRTMELFHEGNKIQNEVIDLGLVQQNEKYGTSFKI
jgi:hypothetical protein